VLLKVNILLRLWRHTWQEKLPRRGKTQTPPTQPYIASPCHIIQRNQESFHADRHQFLTCLRDTDQQVSKKAAHSIPTATSGINQHNPLDRLTPALHKNKTKTKKTLNNKQLKRTCSKEGGVL
jgi:hypothetical protein